MLRLIPSLGLDVVSFSKTLIEGHFLFLSFFLGHRPFMFFFFNITWNYVVYLEITIIIVE